MPPQRALRMRASNMSNMKVKFIFRKDQKPTCTWVPCKNKSVKSIGDEHLCADHFKLSFGWAHNCCDFKSCQRTAKIGDFCIQHHERVISEETGRNKRRRKTKDT